MSFSKMLICRDRLSCCINWPSVNLAVLTFGAFIGRVYFLALIIFVACVCHVNAVLAVVLAVLMLRLAVCIFGAFILAVLE